MEFIAGLGLNQTSFNEEVGRDTFVSINSHTVQSQSEVSPSIAKQLYTAI